MGNVSIAQVVPCTEAEGPGKRFAIWFQGCPLRCSGCCNPEFLSFKGGNIVHTDEIIADIKESLENNDIEGITLMGGEPFAHALSASKISKAAKDMGLSVMVFSGFLLEHLKYLKNESIDSLISLTDILVDGPYMRDLPDNERRWIGSTNQRIHFLTDRYKYDDNWKKKNTLEIRLDRVGITINGFPSAKAKSLWKGWSKNKK